MNDIFNVQGGLEGYQSVLGNASEDLIKAVIADSQTGRDYENTIHTGAGLKVESLESTIKVLTNKEEHIKFWKMLNKKSIYNTVHEYNQQLDYGNDAGGFTLEGETPEFSDANYRRMSQLIKYMGFAGEVTLAAQLVKNADGKNNLARAIENKTALLMRFINKNLATANSTMIPEEFDGLFQQHYEAAEVGNKNIDTYLASGQVVDARGKVLENAIVQDAFNAVTNDNFGFADSIIASPNVFNEYVKQFEDKHRFAIGTGANVGSELGQSVEYIRTQFGRAKVVNDIFFDQKVPVNYNVAANHAKAPAAPTKDGSTPTAVTQSVATSKFSGFTGTYFYGVRARNRYGMSGMTILSTTASTVANATDAVDLKFTATSGAYAATSFVIYKTKKNQAAYTDPKAFFPVFEINTTQLAAGYDGAGAGVVRDRNIWIPGAQSALVCTIDPEYMEYLQLAPIMKMDLAQTAPSSRFMVMNFGTTAMYMPTKIVRIINLGTIQPS
jgi:hypothetical protein